MVREEGVHAPCAVLPVLVNIATPQSVSRGPRQKAALRRLGLFLAAASPSIFAISSADMLTPPNVTPTAISRLSMIQPNATAVAHFASRYASGGMGLARFTSSQPALISDAMPTPIPNKAAPIRPKH